MINRTDLAVEAAMGEKKYTNGINTREYYKNNLLITETEVDFKAGERIGKSAGHYVTVFSKDLFGGQTTDCYSRVLSQLLKDFIPENGLVLVVGLGNREITPDALGPLVSEKILSTRHLHGEFSDLRAVSSLATGVLAQTGIETAEIIKAVCEKIKPAAVVAIDALAARDAERLLTTVQFSDTGIQPGAGVMNKRAEISRKTLGVPVVALGVPTVVDAYSVSGENNGTAPLMVTPKDIDIKTRRAAELLSLAVNSALQQNLSIEEITYLNC